MKVLSYANPREDGPASHHKIADLALLETTPWFLRIVLLQLFMLVLHPIGVLPAIILLVALWIFSQTRSHGLLHLVLISPRVYDFLMSWPGTAMKYCAASIMLLLMYLALGPVAPAPTPPPSATLNLIGSLMVLTLLAENIPGTLMKIDDESDEPRNSVVLLDMRNAVAMMSLFLLSLFIAAYSIHAKN